MIKLDNYTEIQFGYTFRQYKPLRIIKELKVRLSNGDTMIIPENYMSDLASVPRPFRPLFPIMNADVMAFLVHDFLYDFNGYYNEEGKFIRVSKQFADKEMKWQQRYVGVPKLRYYPMYLAVKFFGCYGT